MDRTDRNGVVMLLTLAAPLFLAACTKRDEPPTINAAPLPEVVVTASRLRPEEAEIYDHEQRRRLVARRDR